MKLTAFETRAIDLTAAPELRNSPGEAFANFVTLTLRTDAGVEGIGYAGFLPSAMLPALKAALDGLAGLAMGRDPLDHEAVRLDLLEQGGFGSPAGLVTRAVSAVETALWDIKGKVHGQPLWKLLGGLRNRVPCYASGYLWRNHGLDELAATAARLVEQGFRAMKLRLGAQRSAAAEVERLKVLRQAVGAEIELMVDINQGWDVNRAIRVGRMMEAWDLYWLEDPIHFEDYDGMARIADALDTPLASGEYHYGAAPFAHMLKRGSIDIAMVDLLRAGGIAGWMKIANLAEAMNAPIVSHLATEIQAHTVAAAPNGLTVEHMPWTFPMFEQEPVVEDGEIVLSDAPGLGLSFDAEALDRCAA